MKYSKEELLQDMQRCADEFRRIGMEDVAKLKEKEIENFNKKRGSEK